jgi:hypothetical protein
MKLSKNLSLALLLSFLIPAVAAAKDLGSVNVKNIEEIGVPAAPAPVRVDAPDLPGFLNDLTTEPPFGAGPDVGVDPHPFQLVKPEPGYSSPRMRAFESKGIADSGIPKDMLDRALGYFDANKGNIKNQHYLGIMDFGMHSSKARFFAINMDNNTVKAYHVAHGKGSDPNQTGYLKSFSNVPGSLQTSRGFYEVGNEFQASKTGHSAFLYGRTPGYNDNAAGREILIHGADYVSERNMYAGLSWGCFALDKPVNETIISQFKGGAIIYADKSGDLFRD